MYIYILQRNIFLYIFKMLTVRGFFLFVCFLLLRNDTNHTSGENIFILFISECYRDQKKRQNEMSSFYLFF